jgi:hypothetical protein
VRQGEGRRLCHSATTTLPTCARLAEWVYRRNSLIYKAVVSLSFLLCHVATVSGSLSQTPAQRAPARNKPTARSQRVPWLGARRPAVLGGTRPRGLPEAGHQRRPMLRFFACGEDLSHELPDAPLPGTVASGARAFSSRGIVGS